MKVFVSWSGDESRKLAEGIRAWLPQVLLQNVEAFVSSQDIEKGSRGLSVIANNLDDTDYGIIILTQATQDAPWLNFEAGALGKSLGESRVSPLLVDLTQADVTGPIQQFQMTSLAHIEDVWKLVTDINKLVDNPVPLAQMRILFDNAWPAFEKAIKVAQKGAGPAKTTRPSQEILDEILFRVRNLERRSSPQPRRMGPSGLTREDEHKLVLLVLGLIDSPSAENLRAGIKVGASGPIVTVSVPRDARPDLDGLQQIANDENVRIELDELGIIVEPHGRFRDPAAGKQAD
ncbi:toll/interleukin-1 receptor domain-containing protein [Salinibacterium sp. NG22]|uniref:TIR domain-containing protein n=1 Tax=Salinibacterium sp. NG22 TaxID=2792040 RepID=UPI0018CFDB64|nr:TIR domain-containing protein [Salinibacterium sp. NG22]MBH0109174.1 toll/interleukin-1 receptor domain-containing protein [Salinibacterium sp. NG22]